MQQNKPAAKTHDINKVFVIISLDDGSGFRVTGFDESDSISLSRNSPKYSKSEITSDGTLHIRSVSNDHTGKIKIKIHQHSPVIHNLNALDNRSPANDRLMVSVSDKTNKLMHQGQSAYLVKIADHTYGKDAVFREYEIEVPWLAMDINLG